MAVGERQGVRVCGGMLYEIHDPIRTPYPHTLPKPRSNVCPHPCDDVASVTVLCRTTGGGGTPGGGSVPLASK